MYGWPSYWSGESYQWMYVPVCVPAQPPCVEAPMVVPFELAATAATSPQEAFVGGDGMVRLTLEYLVEAGAAAPQVTVTMNGPDGTTTTWDESAIPEGYHVKHDLPPVQPGALIHLEVVDAIARLRWCERLCC